MKKERTLHQICDVNNTIRFQGLAYDMRDAHTQWVISNKNLSGMSNLDNQILSGLYSRGLALESIRGADLYRFKFRSSNPKDYLFKRGRMEGAHIRGMSQHKGEYFTDKTKVAPDI